MRRSSVGRAAGVVLLGLTLAGCAAGRRGAGGQAVSSSSAASDGWRPLVTGNSLAGWRGYRSQEVPAGWTVTNGTLSKSTSTRDLISQDEFGDFELAWDWKLGTGGNAGVFYRGTEEYDHIYWTGTEYQLLDDANAPDGRSRLTSAGAVYGLYPTPPGVVKPAGEWNTSRIVARGPHVEHWLNGVKVGEYEAWSPEWQAKVKASKFASWPHYGLAKRGHIGLQGDHHGELAIRNLRIRELP